MNSGTHFIPQHLVWGTAGLVGPFMGSVTAKYLMLPYVLFRFATAPSNSNYQANLPLLVFFPGTSLHLLEPICFCIN